MDEEHQQRVKDGILTYDFRHARTAQHFVQDNHEIAAIMGPFGSSKSSACVMRILRHAVEQTPGYDGIRRSRWAIIRNTYKQLEDTTIRTVHDWLPPGQLGVWNSTAHNFFITAIAGCHIELNFRALDRPEHVKNLLSLEITGAWLNEYREIPKAIFEAIHARCGRYPAQSAGGSKWFGVIMDTNPPDTDSYYYKYFEEVKPPNAKIFKQPSGLSKHAENLPNLRPGYYQSIQFGKDPEWVKVYVHGEYGYVVDGKPVYANYSDSLHVADGLKAIPGVPLVLGWDMGLTPQCIICQLTPRGQFHVLQEIVGDNIGMRRFVTEIVKPILLTKYSGHSVISIGDPAGKQRAQTDERSCMEELADADIPTVAAKTNSLVARISGVDQLLTRMIEGKPLFQLDSSCKVLRKGFNGGYRYRRMQVVGDEKFANMPEKNAFSHPHDALQYAAFINDMAIAEHNMAQARQTSTSEDDSTMMAGLT